ncbi:MAG: 16S rRNA (cytosine(967)-C(5))-methyltransferase RsmB [Phycisphaerae bacterium]|jgi:16S rRNA (cytosine967-C5)-methyltransferase
MAGRTPKSARTIAANVLNQLNPKLGYAGVILDKLLPQTDEKQRATDLVLGSIRNRPALDMVITKLADCPIKRIPSKLLNVIRVGTYELIYSPQTPEYSIVNDAVENAKAVAGKKQTAFVNAVLRQITRHLRNRQIPLSQADAQKTMPQSSSTGCEFDIDILPNPKNSPADFLSVAFSLPSWLIKSWLDEHGPELTKQICLAGNRRPSIYIRPNTLKTTSQKLLEKLQTENIDAEAVPDSEMIRIKSPKAVTKLPYFDKGLFSIQDITAAQPVQLLQPKPDWTILDLCAAPGTKTTQLAELTGDKATITATDIDGKRLKKVKENIARLGIKGVTVTEYEKLSENSQFDAVLLDVPCSNTGVLAKRPEVRLRITPKTITKLTKTQTELLEYAASMIKPNGKICYSTCSIQRAENSDVVNAFTKQHPEFSLEKEKLSLPCAEACDYDGGYVAIILRKP